MSLGHNNCYAFTFAFTCFLFCFVFFPCFIVLVIYPSLNGCYNYVNIHLLLLRLHTLGSVNYVLVHTHWCNLVCLCFYFKVLCFLPGLSIVSFVMNNHSQNFLTYCLQKLLKHSSDERFR